MSDAAFSQFADGGDLTIVGQDIATDEGLASAFFLSLFGGNEEDSGRDEDKLKQWWGNYGEPAERTYRSRTQHALTALPLVSANLRRVEDAARQDLEWFTTSKGGTFTVDASSPRLNCVTLKFVVRVTNKTITFELTYQKKIGT